MNLELWQTVNVSSRATDGSSGFPHTDEPSMLQLGRKKSGSRNRRI